MEEYQQKENLSGNMEIFEKVQNTNEFKNESVQPVYIASNKILMRNIYINQKLSTIFSRNTNSYEKINAKHKQTN